MVGMKKEITLREHLNKIHKDWEKSIKKKLGKKGYSLHMSRIAKERQALLKKQLGDEEYSARMRRMALARYGK